MLFIMCLVSFIVPVYNLTEEEVSTCISSIVNQTVLDSEIIIVDDGSNNGIEVYCDSIGKKYGALVIHQQNQGLSVARNTGMRTAHGTWIVHVDGDDWVDNELVECLQKRSINSNADIIVWGFVVDNGKKKQRLLLKNKKAFDNDYFLIKESVLCSILNYDTTFASLALNTSWGKAYRHDFIKQNNLYYDTTLRRAQDAVYNLYAFNRASSIIYIDKALNYYRTNNVSLSRGYDPRTIDYLSLTAKAVERFVSESDSSSRVKEASAIFIQRCFRIINVQYYQHKDNTQPYHKRKKHFNDAISAEPFKSAFSSNLVRQGMINKITDFMYKHKMFGGICLFNNLMSFAIKIKNLAYR
ncbi:MAG: glycosyltransferase [Bacteroidaceae bacterium]|nr:glycosyltransferase [Bacteroidaceae bacterium]